MTAPENVPADVLEAARGHIAQGEMAIITVVNAILAERERCAKIAEEDCRTALAIEHRYKPTWYVRAQKIAAEIRTPTEPQLNKVQQP